MNDEAKPPALRVIHFTWSGQIGGVERVLLDLTEAQSFENLCVPTILLGERRGTDRILITGNGAARVFELGLRSGFDCSLSKLRKAYALFRSHDLIHIHAFNPGIAIAALLSRRPIVYTEHGVLGGSRTKGLLSWLKQRLFAVFVNRCPSCVTCNSNFAKKRLTDRYGLRRKNVEVVYNGSRFGCEFSKDIDTPSELRDRFAGQFIVGTFSRLVPQKRVDLLVKAFAKLADPAGTSLLVVGEGPSRAELSSLIERLKLSSRTYFAGAQERVAPFVARMDVCAFPSQDEAFGLVALEALSAGKPTIVFKDGGGLLEIIEPLNPDDVVDTEAQLAERIDFYRKRTNETGAANARREHAKAFSAERMALEFQRIYDSAIAQKPREQRSGN